MTAPRNILVIDDSPEDRAVVRRLVRSRRPDAVIRETASGEDALAAVRDAPPDCVLLDFHLPDMSGTEWLRRSASSADREPPVPVVLLTGQEDDRVAATVLAAGAEDYLVKDALSAHGLVRAIENAIEKRRIRGELAEQRARTEARTRALEALRDELQARVAELADATRAKDRFLAVMSHEMRTPLNAILGYADLLDLEPEDHLADEPRRYVERMRAAGRHLLDLINDLLDLTQMDADHLVLDVRPVHAAPVVEEVVALLQVQAAAKGITLDADLGPDDLAPVLADLQRLRQVLLNVVGNAIKFTERGGVHVRCEPEGGVVHLVVADSGIGIAPEVLPLVFSEFYQADGELTRRRDGSGLGLTIAQRLVERMGGHIAAQSALGVGSTFTIALPAGDPEHARPDPRPEEPRAERVVAPPRAVATVVAYSRDAAALRQLEARLRTGVRLVWTTRADAVAPLAAREGATLVILDMASLDAAAWESAHPLHGISEAATTAVLLLPSLAPSAEDDRGTGVDLGWVSLVPKPFTTQQLAAAVTTAAQSAAQSGGARERPLVLVVDDDLDSRRVASQALAAAGFEVREAPDGETALVAVRERTPDVVVLDLMMPVLDGFGVLATLRADPRLAGVPVVVLTAKALTGAERQFLVRSAVRVVQKGEHRLADVAALVLRAASGAAASGAAGLAPDA